MMELGKFLTTYDPFEDLMIHAKRDDFRRRVNGYHDYVTVAATLAPVGPWVEIGAGSGNLTAEIRRLGGRCVATDDHSWSWFKEESDYPALWDTRHSIRADAERVGRLVGRHPSIGLISAWPAYQEDWCQRAVSHLASRQLFAYVGESDGCTGDESLRELLRTDFTLEDEVEIEQAYGMYDALFIYRRN